MIRPNVAVIQDTYVSCQYNNNPVNVTDINKSPVVYKSLATGRVPYIIITPVFDYMRYRGKTGRGSGKVKGGSVSGGGAGKNIRGIVTAEKNAWR